MSTPDANWRVTYAAPADTRRELFFRALLVLPLSLLPLGAFAWFVRQAAAGEYRLHDDFGNFQVVELLIAVLFVAVTLLFGGALAWSGVSSLLDGLGAERTAEGPVKALEAYRFGNRTTWSMRVGGHYVVLPRLAFEQLREGQHVRVKLGRFRRELYELSRPAGETPAGLGL